LRTRVAHMARRLEDVSGDSTAAFECHPRSGGAQSISEMGPGAAAPAIGGRLEAKLLRGSGSSVWRYWHLTC
jgi:hypothetical protein